MHNPISPFTYARPNLDISRSRFKRDSDFKTTMSAGLLYPIYCDEYLPGDTFSMDLSMLLRMSTPIHPVMDDAFIDIYWFSVPNRLVWEHWKEFMGESKSDPYLSDTEYSIPQLYRGNFDSYVPYKTVMDYMGIPAGTSPKSFSALPFRAFALIWNEWFRDQNLQNAIDINFGDEDLPYMSDEFMDCDYVTETARGGVLPPVAKYHDYFTSALRQPQKGDPVPIPLNGFAPVYAIGNSYIPTTSDLIADGNNRVLLTQSNGSSDGMNGQYDLKLRYGAMIQSMETQNQSAAYNSVNFGNLFANLNAIGLADDNGSAALSAYATISDLRYAFQIQKLLEADNRGGTRYREIIKAHFGVTSPDQTMQVPELLGGKRIQINMNQVLQTSSTDSTSPQGNTAAYSLTGDLDSAFTKSFTEHGWIIGVACIRTKHTYQQGIDKMFSRRDRYDFYFPELANISEQPIKNKEIYNPTYPGITQDDIDQSDALAEEVFGFQEAWAEYRYKPSRVAGEFRSTYPRSLDVWHYGDYYTSQPYLSDKWIQETRVNIDRTLAVSSDQADQFIGDFYFKCTCVRPMPVNSIPGLADHH